MSQTRDPRAVRVYSELTADLSQSAAYLNALVMTHGCNRDPREIYAASLRALARFPRQAAPDKQEPPRSANRKGSTIPRLSRSPKWSLKSA